MAAKIIGGDPVGRQRQGRSDNIATDIDCDECGKPMIIRKGRRGKFLGCSGYPKCKNTGEVPAQAGSRNSRPTPARTATATSRAAEDRRCPGRGRE